MSDHISKRDTCRLCGSSNLQLVLPMASAPIVDAYVTAQRLDEPQERYPLDIHLCLSCGNSQLGDMVNPEVLYGDYIYETNSSLGLVEHFGEFANQVLERVNPLPNSLVIDIGSNDGSLLQAFKNRGMKVLGIDPARAIALRATEAGVETLPAFFDTALARKIKEEHGPASVVTVNNLFANVDDLDDMAQGIRHLLAPDGVFVLESFYLVDLIQNMGFDTIHHEHLSYPTVGPLDTYFKRHGMELIDVESVDTKGGSIRCTVQMESGPLEVLPSVARAKELESNLGVNNPEVFKAFAARLDSAKTQLVELLDELQANGKSIAGYGASASTTALLYNFDIGGHFPYIVDDNPTKHDRFSPGLHIPVLPSPTIYERNPDYVVILAWRYAEPIIQKHRKYLDGGGHFVVPLPEIRII